jgi:hypothetical protein
MPPGLSKEHRGCPRPAPPGPRSFSERASPRQRRQGRVAKAASPRPRRQGRVAKVRRQGRRAAAHSADALAEASRSDHATGVCQRKMPPAHVPRPTTPSLYAQSGRMPLPLQAPRRPKRGARSRTLLHLSPARFQRRPLDSRAARPIPAPPGPRSFSERASPRPLRQGRVAKAASTWRASTRPLRQGRVAARPPPIPPLRLLKLRAPTMPPGLSKENRACPRPTSFAPVPLRTKRQDAASTLGSTPLTKAGGEVLFATPPVAARFQRHPLDSRAARPIPAPPGPRSFSERASPRFSSPRPRRRPFRRPFRRCAC